MDQRAIRRQGWRLPGRRWAWAFFLASLSGWVPVAGWGRTCGAEAQHHYAQGVQIGQDHAAQGRPCDESCLDEKLRAYQQAIALCPDYAEAHNNLGDVYEKLGRFPEALRHYQRATELDPHLAIAYLSLGDVYLRIGEYAQAVAAYDRGLQLDPEDRLGKRSQRARAQLLRERLKEGDAPDAATIAAVLGCDAVCKRQGVAGVRADRRIALRIPFATASDQLLPDAQRPLRELGKALGDILAAESPKVKFVIEGHTDLRGGEDYNLELSLRRANRVKEVLVQEFRIPAHQLMPLGLGKNRPFSTGTSEADHARNRRVEIVRQDAPEPASPAAETPEAPKAVQPPPGQAEAALVVETAIFHEDLEGRPRPLEAGAILHSGDGFRIYLKPRQSCYVYLLQRDSTGQFGPLNFAPALGVKDHYLRADTAYWVPSPNQWFELDRTPGEETLYVVASHERRDDLAELLRPSVGNPALAAQQPASPKLDLDALKTMGVAGIRPSKNTPVADRPEPPATMVDQRLRDAVEFVHTLTFQHE